MIGHYTNLSEATHTPLDIPLGVLLLKLAVDRVFSLRGHTAITKLIHTVSISLALPLALPAPFFLFVLARYLSPLISSISLIYSSFFSLSRCRGICFQIYLRRVNSAQRRAAASVYRVIAVVGVVYNVARICQPPGTLGHTAGPVRPYVRVDRTRFATYTRRAPASRFTTPDSAH